ncbi:MAG: hypothetical protein JXQ75_09860 [Phycisphaerae bacterium]|nr:hypothetical protein [Phycisphaerae bacterium]
MAQPLAKHRAGGVSEAIWANEAVMNGKETEMLKASIERMYRDSAGNWKSSGSFSRNEIPLAIYGLQKAFEDIIERGNESVETGKVPEETVA